MTQSEDLIIELETAKYINGHKILLKFSDGHMHTIDFKPFFDRSLNPMIRKYLDIEKFKAFSIENGDLQWNDYDLCFPIIDLYEGNIQ